ncbi:plastocyanin/azurin family copper-binding protein [Roseibium sp.]|uniref:plastocyanin/azurin family copper-binding protein n=1 Tax=Roseibium sp. TaxID=1936156 RepID=UPI003D0B9F53
MTMRIAHFPAALLMVIAAVCAAAADDGAAALCEEAEERYVEMFGHPSADEEGVTIVKMYKYNFCPAQLTVPVGTTVRWVNVDKRTSHSVLLADAGIPESDRLFPEESFEFNFLAAGAQNYVCVPHQETQNMIGMITVGD